MIPEQFSRNLGLLSEADQKVLANAAVAVCGVGGMGGICADLLARTGVGHLVLADHDTFELSNLNRQLHATHDSIGRNKAEVISEALHRIHPDMQVTVFSKGVCPETIASILEPAHILVNGMDHMRSSIQLERAARRQGKTIVDAWLTPYASVFVMQPDSPHWESYLDLPTQNVADDQLTDELCREATGKEVEYTLSFGDPYRYVTPELVDDVVSGRLPRPSLGPVVWLSGVMMANEVIKYLLGWPTTDHVGVIYDQYEHRILLRGADSM